MIHEKTMFHGYEFVKGIALDYHLNDDEREKLTLAIFSTMNRHLFDVEQQRLSNTEFQPLPSSEKNIKKIKGD